jgi:hypothetical protein
MRTILRDDDLLTEDEAADLVGRDRFRWLRRKGWLAPQGQTRVDGRPAWTRSNLEFRLEEDRRLRPEKGLRPGERRGTDRGTGYADLFSRDGDRKAVPASGVDALCARVLEGLDDLEGPDGDPETLKAGLEALPPYLLDKLAVLLNRIEEYVQTKCSCSE